MAQYLATVLVASLLATLFVLLAVPVLLVLLALLVAVVLVRVLALLLLLLASLLLVLTVLGHHLLRLCRAPVAPHGANIQVRRMFLRSASCGLRLQGPRGLCRAS